MIKKYYEEEIMRINERLTNILIFFGPIGKKTELITLLEKIINLQNEVSKDSDEELKNMKDVSVQLESDPISFVREGQMFVVSYTYLMGRISILKSMLTSILEKIEDIENQSKLTEEQERRRKEIIEESKKSDDLSYVG